MTTSDNYPVVLEQVLFVRTSVVAVPGFQPSEKTTTAVKPENFIEVSPIPDQPHHFSATMRTKMNTAMDVCAPYSIDIECIATLHTDGTLTPDEESRGVMIIAHSALYGAIREVVAWLTGRQPYGSVMLGLSVLQPPKPADTDQAKV